MQKGRQDPFSMGSASDWDFVGWHWVSIHLLMEENLWWQSGFFVSWSKLSGFSPHRTSLRLLLHCWGLCFIILTLLFLSPNQSNIMVQPPWTFTLTHFLYGSLRYLLGEILCFLLVSAYSLLLFLHWGSGGSVKLREGVDFCCLAPCARYLQQCPTRAQNVCWVMERWMKASSMRTGGGSPWRW